MNQLKTMCVGGGIALLLATVTPATAQQQGGTPHPLDQAAVSYTQLIGHSVEDGVLWVAGDLYKARYVEGGVEYIPALGYAAPHEMPWRYTFSRMQRGAVTLAAEQAGTPAQLIESHAQVRIPRGVGCTEIHHVRSEGLELTYELASRPPGSGDLVVTARVASELVAPHGWFGDEGLSFTLEGIGGIHLSGVVGVDAEGRKVSGGMGWDGRDLTFTLPGSFLDGAAYPVVLDPLVGTSTQIDPANAISSDVYHDAAFNITTNLYAVCWSRTFSSSSAQIRAARFDGTNNAPFGATFIPITSSGSPNLCGRPSIASNAATDQFLIAWEESTSRFAPRDVSCRILRPGGTVSTNIVTLASGNADQFEPDVGGDVRGVDDECLVVWSDSAGGIRGAQVKVSATGDPSAFSTEFITTDSADREPAISKTMRSGRSLVVWRSPANVIQGRFVTANCTPVGVETDVSTGLFGDLSPDVDGDGSVWMVVWQKAEGFVSIGRHDIYCRRVLNGPGDVLAFPEPATDLSQGLELNKDQRDPSVSLHKLRFVITYEDFPSFSASDSQLVAAYVGRDTCAECQDRDVIESGPGRRVLPVVCSRYSGGDNALDRGIIVWSRVPNTLPINGNGFIQGIRSSGTVPALINTGGSCGAAGSASTPDALSGVLGNLQSTVTLSGASPSANFAFLWGAVVGQPRFNCGACQILDPGFLSLNVSTPVVGGSASVQIPTPCNRNLAGIPVEFQFVVFNTGTESCPLVGGQGIGVTDIMRLTLTP